MRRRMLAAAAIASLVSGCGDSPTAPQGTVIGAWGGDGARLVASAAGVRIDVFCGRIRVFRPLVPDAAGRFVLTVPPPVGAAVAASFVRGTVEEPEIRFEVIHVLTTETLTRSYTVTRGESAVISECIVAH